MIRYSLMTLAFFLAAPTFASVKEKQCKLIEGNSFLQVALVEYVRSTVLKSITLAPDWDSHYEEVVYVDGCEKLDSEYLCTNPLDDINIVAGFNGTTLKIENEDGSADIYECK